MMHQKLDFTQLSSEEDSKTYTSIIMNNCYGEKDFDKDVAKQYFMDMVENIKSKKSSPASKFFTLFIIRQFISMYETKFISIFSSNLLFVQMQQLAYTDMKKPVNEKGKNLFKNDEKEKYGNKMIRLCLETLMVLGETFPYKNNTKTEPTKFKKVLNVLQTEKAVLPTEMIYYEKKKKAQSKQKKEEAPKVEVSKNKKPNYERFMDFTKLKIEEYVGNLEDCETLDEVQEQIIKKHEILSKELQKFDEFGDKIFDQSPQLADTYLALREFMETQAKLYETYIPKNQFQAYRQKIHKVFKTQFPASTPQSAIRKSKPSEQKMQMEKPRMTDSKMVKEDKKSETQKSKVIKEEKKPETSKSKIKTEEVLGLKNSNLIGSIFQKLDQRSKSQVSGFNLLKKSLQKEKQQNQAHPPRSRTKGTIKTSKIDASTFTKSIVKAATIFTNPPNLHPPIKYYEGETVRQIKELQEILYDIKKDQGMRRFKLANIKDRYPLYENSNLQIGFKTQPIYDEVQNFSGIISIELFFGNKTTKQIRDFSIFFEGDNSSLIYSNPLQIPSIIKPENQIKHQILSIPKKIPFSFTNMKFSYEIQDSSFHTSAALPNSLLKFCYYLPLMKEEFDEYWKSLTVLYQSQPFNLSHCIPPSSLKKYIEALAEGTSYAEFAESGSQVDYELFCSLEIKSLYSCILKINIRPNLHVILQIGSIDPSQDHCDHMKFYLQTLQFILQQSR